MALTSSKQQPTHARFFTSATIRAPCTPVAPSSFQSSLSISTAVAPSTSAQSSLAPTVVDPDAPVGVPDAYVTPNDRVLSVAAPGTPTGTPRR